MQTITESKPLHNDCADSLQEILGAEVIVRCLQAEGVKQIWGYPGGAVLYIYDALFHQAKEIKHILVRHEQAAIHAADGFARASGEVGVALVTSGPGVTNAITGIATAYMDSIPMVIITGQVPVAAIGLDAFQECDTVGITRPVVKHNFLVKDVKDLEVAIRRAFHIARSGRPGPVVVDIPKDITKTKVVYQGQVQTQLRSYAPMLKGHLGQIRKAVQVLLNAKRPYIYTGGGIVLAGAEKALARLVDTLGVPCTHTLMGLGAYPAASGKNFIGMLGMHGTYEANMAMQNCDVLLALGARFDDRVIGNPAHFASHSRKIIHVDIDPSSISKRVKVDIPIVGDVLEVINDLQKELGESQHQLDAKALAQWWQEIKAWQAKDCLKFQKDTRLIKPQSVILQLYKLTARNPNVYITADVGQHQMWVAQHYKFEYTRRWINSGGLGTMGFGFPAAMGIKQAIPEAEVVCVSGDGSIQMCLQELATCKQYGSPVKIICLNNGYLGMVRQWQQLEYAGRYSHSYMDSLPDFVKLAEAYGHVGIQIHKPKEIKPALEKMLSIQDRCVFLDVLIDPSENVWPMVQAGKGITDMLLGSEEL